MRLVIIISILLFCTCITGGCISHTTSPPPVPGPPPVDPGEPGSNYGGTSIAIAFKGDEISTSSSEAKDLFIKGLTNLTQYGQYNESLHFFDAALAIDPNFTEALMAKGVALHNMRRYDEAIIAYNEALEINPRESGVWYVKGMTLKNMGRYEEAAECNRMASTLDPRYSTG